MSQYITATETFTDYEVKSHITEYLQCVTM